MEKNKVLIGEGTSRRDPTDEKGKAPIRCFDGNDQPHEPFWTVRESVDGSEPEIEFDGYISQFSWLDDDITPKLFKDDLYRVGKGEPITIRMNSYGGEVVAASMISSIIKDYPGKVTVQIDGVAASAATLVAMAGDHVRMQEGAYFMIHDPSFVFFMAQLNIETMGRYLEELRAVKEGSVNVYESRTGLSRDRISRMMVEETWMDATKAMALGFVDEVMRGTSKKLSLPQNAAMVNGLSNFANVPQEVLDAIKPSDQPAEEEPSELQMSEEEQREAQILRERVSSILKKEKQNA